MGNLPIKPKTAKKVQLAPRGEDCPQVGPVASWPSLCGLCTGFYSTHSCMGIVRNHYYVVLSNMFLFSPLLTCSWFFILIPGRWWSNSTHIFSKWVAQPPTRKPTANLSEWQSSWGTMAWFPNFQYEEIIFTNSRSPKNKTSTKTALKHGNLWRSCWRTSILYTLGHAKRPL